MIRRFNNHTQGIEHDSIPQAAQNQDAATHGEGSHEFLPEPGQASGYRPVALHEQGRIGERGDLFPLRSTNHPDEDLRGDADMGGMAWSHHPAVLHGHSAGAAVSESAQPATGRPAPRLEHLIWLHTLTNAQIVRENIESLSKEKSAEQISKLLEDHLLRYGLQASIVSLCVSVALMFARQFFPLLESDGSTSEFWVVLASVVTTLAMGLIYVSFSTATRYFTAKRGK